MRQTLNAGNEFKHMRAGETLCRRLAAASPGGDVSIDQLVRGRSAKQRKRQEKMGNL